MSLFFITGISASGKSEVCQYLKNRGFETYDTDEDGFAKWRHNVTGYIHPKSSVKKEQRTEQFLKEHSWKVPRQDVKQLAEAARDKTVFLCGVAANEEELKDLFAATFALVIDSDTLRHRLVTRTNNDWGKQPHELEQTMQWHKKVGDLYEKLGYITIDATLPVEQVVDNILSKVEALKG